MIYNTQELKKYTIYIYISNNKKLYDYEFLGVYENEGQIEIHIDEGKKLEK